MSQHDLVIENQAGAAFRADLNEALEAIATNQSGSVEPNPSYPFQLWADTGTGTLKQRNAANTGWVRIGLLGAANLGLLLPGTVIFHAKNTVPPGFLKANGGAVSRTTYADLFAEIGTSFGAGDGSTTFNLPELRGEFARGWDDGRGIDTSRVFGSTQLDALQDHLHLLYKTWGSGNRGGVMYSELGVAEVVNSVYNGLVTGGARVATETRPRNVALLACIKY